MKILRDFGLQLFLVLICIVGSASSSTSVKELPACTNVSGTIFCGVTIEGVTIVGGSASNYLRGDGSAALMPTIPTYTDLGGGAITITKRAIGTVTPNTGDGYSIDISGAGFSNVIGVSIVPVRGSVTAATASPEISIESITTSAIVVNIVEGNPNTVNILGSLVLLGSSETFVTSFTNLTLRVEIYGN